MKKWLMKPNVTEISRKLSADTGISPFISYILAGRGIINIEKCEEFFRNPSLSDPMQLQDMDKAVSIIRKALDDGEKITVFGDYDCDGVTSTVILCNYLEAVGAEVNHYIPTRTEGYGMNIDAVKKIIKGGTSLIITVDNGISAINEAEYIKNHGVSLIITDHHQVSEVLPIADAIINPNRPDDISEYKKLAGCGVVLKLISALEENSDTVLEEYGDLAAIGTVGDVVPLMGENRTIVSRGISNMVYSENPGLEQLLRCCKLSAENVTSASLAFSVCPRINAAGRYGTAEKAVELLTCEDPSLAGAKAQELCDLNTKRQNAEKEIIIEAEKQILDDPSLLNQRVLIVSGEGWNHGIIGIVSAKLLGKYGKPTIVISIEGDEARGSARSVEGLSLFRLLQANENLLTKFGGHTKAAGFSLNTSDLDEFISSIYKTAAEISGNKAVADVIEIDKEVAIGDLTLENVSNLSNLQPFGEANPIPVFMLKSCVIKSKKPLKDGKYLSFEIGFGNEKYKVLAFNMTYEGFRFNTGDHVDIVVNAEVNNFGGSTSVTLNLKDIRRTGFNQDRYFAAKNTYECLSRGEAVDSRLLKRIIPQKAEIKTVYDILRKCTRLSSVIDEAMEKGINYCMVRVIFDILAEFRLCFTDPVNDTVILIPSKEKADLTKSTLLLKLSSLVSNNSQ